MLIASNMFQLGICQVSCGSDITPLKWLVMSLLLMFSDLAQKDRLQEQRNSVYSVRNSGRKAISAP